VSALPPTRFSQWTDFGYGSFYKRYVEGLRRLARRRFACSPEQADALAHAFVAEQSTAATGGLLGSFDRERPFRGYVVVAFLRYCQRSLGRAPSGEDLREDLPAPPGDDPAAKLVAEEAEALRAQVRDAVEEARASLLARGVLDASERAYLQLKWPADRGAPPLSDLAIARRLAQRGLLSAKSEAALVRAGSRLGARVGRQLVARLHGLLQEAYRQHYPEQSEDERAEGTRLSLGAIVHVLSLEESGGDEES